MQRVNEKNHPDLVSGADLIPQYCTWTSPRSSTILRELKLAIVHVYLLSCLLPSWSSALIVGVLSVGPNTCSDMS